MNDNTAAIKNAMTIDVEDYFQVSAFEPYIPRSDWDNYEGRVEASTDRVLDLFDQFGIKATFFTLGVVADRYPNMIKRIVSDGHELASHGWDHKRVSSLTRKEFVDDTGRSKQVLEDLSGTAIQGYRAPSYSFTEQNQWAHDVLLENGYRYSSSVAPIKHDHYGIPGAPRFAFGCVNNGLLEIPVSTIHVMNKNLPCGGGGWFRLYPYEVSRWAINRVNQKENEAVMFYFHPWEIDPEQPRIPGLDLKTRFRHYQNLHRMEPKLQRLLGDFSWSTVTDVYANALNGIETNRPANKGIIRPNSLGPAFAS